jgi:hypothetical protein
MRAVRSYHAANGTAKGEPPLLTLQQRDGASYETTHRSAGSLRLVGRGMDEEPDDMIGGEKHELVPAAHLDAGFPSPTKGAWAPYAHRCTKPGANTRRGQLCTA